MSDDNKATRRKQWAVVGVIAGIVGVLAFTAYALVSELSSKSVQQKAPQSIQLGGAGRAAGADAAWWAAADDRLRKIEKRQEDIAATAAATPPQTAATTEALNGKIAALEADFRKTMDGYAAAMEKVEGENAQLRAQLEQASLASAGRGGATIPGQPGYGDLPADGNVFGNATDRRRMAESLTGDVGASASGPPSKTKPTIVNIKLSSRDVPNQPTRTHDPKLYVAAGSYAPIRIISGGDVTAGVTDQSDPKPMLGRIQGSARGVVDRGKMRTTDLKGCLVTLEGRADLPSERVYGRPVRMSCPAEGGTVRELKVKGYLADRGTAGVRGVVTERTGDLAGKAAIAGLVGGLGSTVNGALNPALGGFSIAGDDRSTGRKLKEAGLGGIGGGAQSAGDRLADYYIDRLEQIQPVISAPTGAELELVFLEGFYLDGRANGDTEDQALPDLPAVAANIPGVIPPLVQNAIAGAQRK